VTLSENGRLKEKREEAPHLSLNTTGEAFMIIAFIYSCKPQYKKCYKIFSAQKCYKAKRFAIALDHV